MTTTTTDLEPQHIFEARLAALLADATQRAEDAAAAEEAASALVTEARGEFRIGRALRGPWDAASKKLSKLQDQRADADAALLATQRDVARQREARHAAEVLTQRAERRELQTARASSLIRAAAIFTEIRDALDELDELPAIPPLATYRGDRDRLFEALNRLASRY